MKLNPPASSSDLEVARAVARRLHDRARQAGRPGTPVEASPPAAPPSSTPAPVTQPPEPTFQPPDFERPLAEPEGVAVASSEAERALDEPEGQQTPEPEPEPPAPEIAAPEPATPETPEAEPPAELPVSEPPPDHEHEPVSMESPLTEESPGDDSEMPPVDTPVFEPPPFEPPAFEPPPLEEPPADVLEPRLPDDPFAADPPALDEAGPPDAPSSSEDAWGSEPEDALSELTGPPAEPSLEGLEPPTAAYEDDPGAGVEDLLGGGATAAAEDESPFDAVGEPGTAPGEPDDPVASPGPSWDDVAEACMALAGAHGAMLVDTSGQVLTARGEWPEPGPDAIAGRLVSMMDRTLQEAPTRSVSAPIGGQHLTAWRIPASEGYLTVVFMGEAPLSTDVRPDIDEHIRRALG